ncbi:MAG TPA: tRNA-dependent cyclodipeptide synthase [Candidatus Babeliales bacterium]|jgi:tRNA-dependent cyclodipeptide synthase|nr:tRNA-dependent cyclodipeptide synthase [Candidatus Babeliales bacterium]
MLKKDHALIAVSAFNGYFSIKNMVILFNWAYKEFNNFNVFLMDEVSIFNLMALGYDKEQALKKTKKHDSNLKNKVIKSLNTIGFNQISQSDTYLEAYKRYVHIFETNASFKKDCLDATKMMLLKKINNVSDKALHLSLKYLLAELPIWLDIPYVLNLPSSVLVYKDLPFSWERICYNYNLLSPQQEILIKYVDKSKHDTK